MKQYEQEMEARLQALYSDSRACATFAYTELALHFVFGSDYEARDRVNKQPAFWNGVLGALQASTFVSLGRMYDADNKRNTIQSLLKFSSGHIGLFSRTVLRQRKERVGLAPTAAAAFASSAYVPTSADFAALTAATAPLQQSYQKYIQPIRHEIFAHAGKLSPFDRDALFTKVMVRALEKLVVFPLQLHRALWGLYHNGQKPELESAPIVIADALRAIPPEGTNSWEHLHAAKNAVEFVDWLRTAPMPRDKEMDGLAARMAELLEKGE